MAETLVESMAGEWDPSEYQDDYRDDLMKLIRARAKRGELNSVPEEIEKKAAPVRSAKVVDLASLLAQSLETKHRRPAKAARAGRATRRPRRERSLKRSA
jgi:DNA end-binding protein Ku